MSLTPRARNVRVATGVSSAAVVTASRTRWEHGVPSPQRQYYIYKLCLFIHSFNLNVTYIIIPFYILPQINKCQIKTNRLQRFDNKSIFLPSEMNTLNVRFTHGLTVFSGTVQTAFIQPHPDAKVKQSLHYFILQ